MAVTAAALNIIISSQGGEQAQRAINQASKAVDEAGIKAKASAGGFDAFHDAINGGAGDLEIFASQVRALEQELNTVGMALTGMGALGVGFFALATNESKQFTSAMANVNSIARLTDSELSNLEESVIGLSTQFGAVPTDLADGLYEIVSSGFEASEALGILESATIAAGAGMTDTATSAKAITAVLNAYGLEASEAGNVSDVLFKIVYSGVITFEELANNLGNTVPLAAALGVSIEELGAAYSQLTLSGIGASQAETQISALMRAAINPTQELTDAVEAYGYESAEAMIAAEGLAGFLIFLADASGGTTSGLLELVGTAEAVNAALVLGKDNGAGYTAMLADMDDAAQNGASTLEVFGIQMDNAAGSVKLAQAEIAAAMIAIGSNLEPLVGMGADVVAGIVGAFNELPGPVQAAVVTLGAFTSVATLASGSLLLIIPRVVAFRTAMQSLRDSGSILGALVTRIAPLTLGLGALAAVGVYVWQSFQDQKQAADDYRASISTLTDTLESLRRQGLRDRAGQGEGLAGMFDQVDERSLQYMDEWIDRISQMKIGSAEWAAETERLNAFREVSVAQQVELNGLLNEALSDPNIDVDAWMNWATTLLIGAENAEELKAAVDLIIATPLSDFALDGAASMTNMERATAGLTGALGALEAKKAALPGILAEAIADYNDHIAEVVDNLTHLQEVAGYGDPLSQWNLSGHASDMSLLAMNATQAATALDSVFRVVVGNTNAIASQADSVLQWATELINVEGELGKIDQLLADGLITLEQYNAAQGAYNSIAQDTASIQDYVLKIQAMQAPLIAEQTAALENQMEVIANLPAAQQLVALGWMDATTAGRAMEFQTLAIAAANGELGANGEEAFTSMITGAANADPVLKALLIDMGLISEGANGTIKVHLDGVDGALSEMEELMVVMVNYMDLMDNNALDGSVNFEILGLDDPRDKLDEIEKKVTGLDTLQADIDVLVNTPSGDPGNPFTPEFLNILGDLPAARVYADSSEAMRQIQELAATPIESMKLPVELDYGSLGASAGASAGSAAAGLFGGGDTITIPATLDIDTSVLDTLFTDESAQTITINAVNNATPVLDDLQVRLAGFTMSEWMVTVGADTSAAVEPLNEVIRVHTDLSTIPANVIVTGDSTDAITAINDVRDNMGSLNGGSAFIWVWGDGSDAITAINEVRDNLGSLQGATANISITGDNTNAINAISSIQAYNGTILATTYVDIVTRQIGGSMAARATGGYVEEDYTLVGELGPELVSLPRGSYVHTSAQSMSMMSGSNSGGVHIAPNAISITVNAKTDADADEIAITVGSALEEAIYQRRAGFGGVR